MTHSALTRKLIADGLSPARAFATKVRQLAPYSVFLADDQQTYLVSTLSLPQHPVCSCGVRAYADMICAALNLASRACADVGRSA